MIKMFTNTIMTNLTIYIIRKIDNTTILLNITKLIYTTYYTVYNRITKPINICNMLSKR